MPHDPDALFDLPKPARAHARHTDPDTSHEAAESLDADTITRSQAEVWAVLDYSGPCTDTALVTLYQYHDANRTDLPGYGTVLPQSPSGIRTRRRELVEKGRVADTGHRLRLGSGRNAIVWKAVR